MVFESIVVDLLNRFIGDYVENLDRSQLKLGIFGGDAVLTNLEVKPTALDDLDLPVKLKSGHLGRLTLKIPWKNLYTEPVIASIEGLYILVVPNRGVKYNAEKEEKYSQDAKQKELQKIEDARKAKKEKEKQKDKDGKEPADTFAEKMAGQVIKNLQVTIRDIHVRFEDEYTNRARPFAAGITLHNLRFQTTDDNWQPKIITETVSLIYKIADLDSLSVYWNSNTEMISRLNSRDEIRTALQSAIATKHEIPKHFCYVLRPICLSAHLRLNQKPERDGTNWSTPKIWSTLVVDELGLDIGKLQYQDIMEFLEGMERMNVSSRYLKYRPDLKEYKAHAKEWWHFAFTSIIEDQVRRRRRNWSWSNMKEHRSLVRQYKAAWLDKQTNKKPSNQTLDIITMAEKRLDVLNLNVARQEAELEIERKGLKRAEEQGGWFSGWFGGGGGGGTKAKSDTVKDFADKFNEAMSPEEKKKMYEAIDYNENQVAAAYPKEFVENKLAFKMDKLGLRVFDDLANGSRQQVLTLSWTGVYADVEQRPADKGALKVDAKMQTISIEGLKEHENTIPALIGSMLPPTHVGAKPSAFATPSKQTEPLLALKFETNPLDRSCDQRVQLKSRPLNIVYHAASINKLAEVFRPPESVQLKQLTAAAMAKYEEVKARSTTGLEYALQHRTVLQLDIDFEPLLLVVPSKGVFDSGSSVLLLDLGEFRIKTIEAVSNEPIEKLTARKSESERLSILLDKAYDKFQVDLKSLQILFAAPGADWNAARHKSVTPLHVLKPTGFSIMLERCTIEDLLLPKMKVLGSLPDLHFTISDQRLLDILALGLSIPTPPPAPAPKTTIVIEEPSLADRAKVRMIMKNDTELAIEEKDEDAEEKEESREPSPRKKSKAQAASQEQVNMELSLILKEISIDIYAKDDNQTETIAQLKLTVQNIGADLKQTNYSMHLKAYLGNVEIKHGKFKDWISNEHLMMIENPLRMSPESPLVQLEFTSADRNGPNFASEYQMTETLLKAKINSIHLNLHQDAFLHVQKLANQLQAEMTRVKSQFAPPPTEASNQLAPPASGMRSRSGSQLSLRSLGIGVSPSRRNSQSRSGSNRKGKRTTREQEQERLSFEERIINTKILAEIDWIRINVGDIHSLITTINVKGTEADITMRPKQMVFLSALRDVSITNPQLKTWHHKVLAVEPGKDVFRMQFLQNTRTDEERRRMKPDDFDMSLTVHFAELRFVYTNIWLTNLLGWLGPFQAVAQEAASQTSAVIAEKGRESAHAMHEQASRILLDVNINAPVVVIPRNSRSDEALLADLGNLRIKNRLTTTKLPNSDVAAVLDDMVLELLDMKVARVQFANEQVLAECQLLEPVTFNLSVTRNLSYEWYKLKPEIAVSAKLPALTASLSQEDYTIVMATLNENLAEGQPPKPPPSSAGGKSAAPKNLATMSAPGALAVEDGDRFADSSEEGAIQMQVTAETHTTSTGEKLTLAKSSPAVIEDKRTPRIIFSFQLDSVTASLFMGSSNLQSGLAARQADRSLARIQLQTISVSGEMMADNSLAAKVLVIALIMDDARTGLDLGITRLMDKRVSKQYGHALDNMVDVTFTQDAANNQIALVKLSPFYLCFAPEFLAALGAFFAAPPTEELTEAEKINAAKASEAAKAALNEQAEKKKRYEEQQKALVRRTGTFSLNFEMKRPEILLIEDATSPDETKALILKFDTALTMRNTPDTDVIQGGITGLEIFSSYYKEQRRKEYFVPVLKPCDITLAGQKAFGEGQRLDIRMTPFIFKVSPSIIQLLSCVASNYSEKAAETQQEMKDKKEKAGAKLDVWARRPLADCKFWFLKVLSAEEANENLTELEEAAQITDEEPQPLGKMCEEQLIFTMESFVMTVESGIGAKTIPLLQLNTVLSADVRNWSTGLTVSGSLATEMAYFNEPLNTWEPVIEPIEYNGSYKTWELFLAVKQRSIYDEVDEDSFFQPPEMVISVRSIDMLELTVTKQFLAALTKLSDIFTSAANKTLLHPAIEAPDTAECPYVISNEAGLDFEVLPIGDVRPVSGNKTALPTNALIGLTTKSGTSKLSKAQSMSVFREDAERDSELMLNLGLPVFHSVREINLSRADKRVFTLPTTQLYPGEMWKLVSEVKADLGQKIIVLRSPVQVINHLSMEIEVFCLNDINLELCGKVSGDESLNLSLPAVYTPKGELFFKPAGEQYDTSAQGVSWRTFSGQTEVSNTIFCNEVSGSGVALYIQVFAEVEYACFENTTKKNLSTECFKIHLRPAVVFHNVMPCTVQVQPPGFDKITIEGGQSESLLTVNPGHNSFFVTMTDFEGVTWKCNLALEKQPEMLTSRSFLGTRADSGRQVTMDLALHTSSLQGSLQCSLYSPFWMVNKTGLNLAYKDSSRASRGGSGWRDCSPCFASRQSSSANDDDEHEEDDGVVNHSADFNEPVFFTFRGKSLFEKKKALLKVLDSDWSDKFPLDVVGNSGCVTCKTKDGRRYEVTVTIQLSNSGLTKIITFSPFYLLDNRCKFPIQVSESTPGITKEDWVTVPNRLEDAAIRRLSAARKKSSIASTPAIQCIGFWPRQSAKQMLMTARYSDSGGQTTAPFPFTDTFETLLKLPSELIPSLSNRHGIYVSVNVSETSVIVSFQDYTEGMAAVQIVNDTEKLNIEYCQKGQLEKHTCPPKECVLFSWESIVAKRELLWTCGDKKDVAEALTKDDVGEFFAATDQKVYWCSFLNGRQRVLLFTEDLAICMSANEPYELEKVDMEVDASFKGIGISLVNNVIHTEIAYISIVSSGTVWEVKKKRKKWTALSMRECDLLEEAFQRFEVAKEAGTKPKPVFTVDKYEVDFEQMTLLKPAERQIRRSFQTGFWGRYKTSPHNIQVHAKINKLQIDNQLPACVFPVVFAVVVPSKSVTAEAVPKPFSELSFVMRKAEHSNVPQIKYFKVLVQEIAVKIDQGFINAIIALFAAGPTSAVHGPELYEKDVKLTQMTLSDFALQTVSTEQKSYYEYMHFSPIKIHLSFSQGGFSGDSAKGSMQIHSEFINLFVKSVGVTLTEIQDVIFKLGYYEEKSIFMNRQQLVSKLTSHYSKQALKQFYVLVLGLDVIGNPFGLIRNLGEGVQDFFYEPIQGAVQGPEEFAEGLVLGVKSLFGHAVGGAAGAVSRITGTLGKGLAALTMDEEYQRKRQQMLTRRPRNAKEGMAQSGKGLVMGFVDGVTGVVMRPVEGAQQEGAAGFFKGVGKGLVGLVARPTAGVVDFASGTLDVVKTVAECAEETHRVRPPRYLQMDGIVRPYNHVESEGNRVLHETDKGKYVATDFYVAHSPTTTDKKYVLLLTDKRVMLVTRSNIFGQWSVEWSLLWTDILQPPEFDKQGRLMFMFKEQKKKVLGVFGKAGTGKAVTFPDSRLAEIMLRKSVETFNRAIA